MSKLTKVVNTIHESAGCIDELKVQSKSIVSIANSMVDCIHDGGVIYVCGNGGSMADAQHFVAELVGRFAIKDREALPAIALGTNPASVTAIANDFGFPWVFARELRCLAKQEDLLLAISTSGTSPNVMHACKEAVGVGMYSAGLTGGGIVEEGKPGIWVYCDECIYVPSENTARIQEGHGLILHILAELVEQAMFTRSKDGQ